MKRIIITIAALALALAAPMASAAAAPDAAKWAAKYRQWQEETKWQPRTFSKMKCVVALKKAGVWVHVKEWIVANDLYDEYIAAQDFKEDNPFFLVGKAALQAALGWTDEQVEALLSQCVAEE